MNTDRLSLLSERSKIARQAYQQGFTNSMRQRIDEIDKLLKNVSIEDTYFFVFAADSSQA